MDIPLERSYPTPLSNSSLLPLLLLSLSRQRYTPRSLTDIKDEYDYIVVGGGAAGSVVAGRLSEVPCIKVLLLEAGPEPPLLTEVPRLSPYFQNSDVAWKFITVPQKYTASGLVNKQIGCLSGRMLGGSGSMNGMAYVRGNRKTFDDWSENGAKGWSYDEVFPYFLKLEDNRDIAFLPDGYHSTGGPITVERPRYQSEFKAALHEAATALGYRFVDSNAERQAGFYDLQANIIDSQRCSSVKGYLVPAENRTNLDILLNAEVTKVIIEDGESTGVEFLHNGATRSVKARRETVVSAGTINTPKLLMLSGVGPQEELQKLSVPLVVDLPVGKNFQDHAATYYPFILNASIRGLQEEISDPSNIKDYINNRTGPLAGIESYVIAFLPEENAAAPVDDPSYEISFSEFATLSASQFRMKPEVYHQFFGPYEGQPVFRCVVNNLQPKSRGTITLGSRNPSDPPVIDPNYLENPADEQDLIEGLKLCKKMVKTAPLRALGAQPFETSLPGCEEYVSDDDEYFRCFVRSFLVSYLHYAGTSKMGDPEDLTTVVDPELRVKNIKRLRVVDASVMPSVTSGNTYIPTVMIAEKASDMIKASISCSKENIFGPWEFHLKMEREKILPKSFP